MVLRHKLLVIAAVGVLTHGDAHAQSRGSWAFKLGYNEVTPQVRSSELGPPSMSGSRADVGKARNILVTGATMLTDNVSVELFLGTPCKHDILGAGALAGVGKIGTVTQLPPSVFLQYRLFSPDSAWRPYVGLGATYAFFRDEKGSAKLDGITNPGSSQPTTFKVDAAFGITPQVGLVYSWDGKWFLDLGFARSYISTRATFSTGQKIDVRLNPVIANISIGSRF